MMDKSRYDYLKGKTVSLNGMYNYWRQKRNRPSKPCNKWRVYFVDLETGEPDSYEYFSLADAKASAALLQAEGHLEVQIKQVGSVS